jgi:hypothetical protein
MNDDRRTARIVGLSLAGICCLCFALSALGLSQDKSYEAELLAADNRMAPVLFVNQIRPVPALDDARTW